MSYNGNKLETLLSAYHQARVHRFNANWRLISLHTQAQVIASYSITTF